MTVLLCVPSNVHRIRNDESKLVVSNWRHRRIKTHHDHSLKSHGHNFAQYCAHCVFCAHVGMCLCTCVCLVLCPLNAIQIFIIFEFQAFDLFPFKKYSEKSYWIAARRTDGWIAWTWHTVLRLHLKHEY